MSDAPDLQAGQHAHARIAPHIHRTPIWTCRAIDEQAGAQLFFKCENLQKVGAFKIRGAVNTVFSLSDEQAAAGVVTHSSGNHVAALSLAARLRGIPAYIVMPDNSSPVKQAAVAGYGGRITLSEPGDQARESTAAAVQRDTGATLVHPYNDPRIIAGQGTVAIELLEQVPELDAILAPVGGGGLLSGILTAAKALRPDLPVIGCEPAEADDAYRSWQAGKLIPLESTNTVADGLRTSLGTLTFPIIHRLVDRIVTVSEAQIVAALRMSLERMKLVIEPSSAVPLAAILSGQLEELRGRRLGVVLSGGNLDFSRLPW